MPIVTLSAKGQLVIPKEVRKALGIRVKQKVFFKVVKGNLVEITPLPKDPIKHFCGIFKEGSSLTRALLNERKEEKKRDEKERSGFFRPSRVSKARR